MSNDNTSEVDMIHVLIADDHSIVRRGLRQILSETGDMILVGEAVTAQDALLAARTSTCDVLVLDLSMPGRGGFDMLKDLRHYLPRLPVLILSIYPQEQFAVRALQAGAAGYLTKESAPEELVHAIRRVASGGRYITGGMAELLADHIGGPQVFLAHEALSEREFQVLRMIAAGRTPKQIAAALLLSVKTISTYRTRILEKMQFKTNAEIVRYVIQHQLADVSC